MGFNLPGWNGQDLHHMLTVSPWEYLDLFNAIARKSIKLLRSERKRIYILIDEVGFRKKGNQSACVGHQYIGSIGKNDNGQVAVTAALSSEAFYCPVSMELFMPKSWQDDQERRSKTGIPTSKKSESKWLMGLSMIKTLFKKLSGNVECVVFDALYGYNIDLLYQLMKLKIPFVGDVKGKLLIHVAKPKMRVPRWSGKGRKFFKKHPTTPPILIEDYMKGLQHKDFTHLTVRNGTKGVIQSQYHKRKVWVLHEPSNSLIALLLLIRKQADGEIKYCLGFFNDQKVGLLRMARAQAQRAFVERVFEEGKNILGMADYQTRGWNGFHRHMALCSLALLFLMQQKIALQSFIGRITAYQLQSIINSSIATLDSLDQVINRLAQQIPQYQKQIQNQLKIVT
jgi:SRSO17 transposase